MTFFNLTRDTDFQCQSARGTLFENITDFLKNLVEKKFSIVIKTSHLKYLFICQLHLTCNIISASDVQPTDYSFIKLVT